MSDNKTIAIFGGSFNPPAIHHIRIIEALLTNFNKVAIVPCGPRKDKSSTNILDLTHRKRLCELAFSKTNNTLLDLDDLNNSIFTPSIDLYKKYSNDYDAYLVVGADIVLKSKEGKSQIQKYWVLGEELWEIAKFAILTRKEFSIRKSDLPPHSDIININIPGSSSKIRELISKGLDFKEFLSPSVYQYVIDHGLYNNQNIGI